MRVRKDVEERIRANRMAMLKKRRKKLTVVLSPTGGEELLDEATKEKARQAALEHFAPKRPVKGEYLPKTYPEGVDAAVSA